MTDDPDTAVLTTIRAGERALPFDPGTRAPDAHLVFIGKAETAWTQRGDCPKNMGQARERNVQAQVLVDEDYREGLLGLEAHSHVIILTWLHRSARDLIVQQPRHAEEPRGTFALRSPVRPNPIGLHVARLVSVDMAEGRLVLEALDVLDGTPVIDIKPYFASSDRPDLEG
ncbi:tRNA (N6-threonylcarbamoyladenosine(37)-N6)-methyltransferase TrmO [Tianweitania populi]|uniref:tRNA (N6-threonylcarbamoyladenosine(37)-N6)-methyltransferase TrmO n=1 Tax=Tianweitania populi TaxID=1607949 RepID=A0A8J3DVL8_9HYPH|nr:tRNA (N6-threonylcarbamoyladenosine(37)-N6)-methyltransferase TrmO [Tianweitania populi]GHD11055.1 tRNA (N6-threonylcarbamoyladenosine(37)-N6)-methyltransferase TrmO [Tianweitania populi]